MSLSDRITTVTRGGKSSLSVTLQDGTVVPTIDTQAVIAGQDLWSDKGHPGGYLPTDGLKLLDPHGAMHQYLSPTGTMIDGYWQLDGYAALVTHTNRPQAKGGRVVYGKVKTKSMTAADWDDMNPGVANGLYRHSKSYEVFDPYEMTEAIERNIVDEDGKPMKASSMMFLGDKGRSGLVVLIKMRPWEHEVQEALGTGADEYLLIHNPSDRYITTKNVSNVWVCQNAMLADLGEEKKGSVYTTSHAKNVLYRVDDVLRTAWERGLQTRNSVQQAMLHLQATKMTVDEAREMDEAVYLLPGAPEENHFGKLSLKERTENWEGRRNLVLATREMVIAAYTEPAIMERAGVTRQAAGTGFGLVQAATWVGTKMNARDERYRLEKLVDGPNGALMSKAIHWTLEATGYKASNN